MRDAGALGRSPFATGRSVAGRAIHAYAVGTGPTRLLVHGGIHGDEPGARSLVEAFAEGLAAFRGPRVVLIPAVNPDGLAAGVKDNARGVDLNRNFPARSFGDAALRPGDSPGAAPLSEPESRFLAAIVEAEAPARIVAVHQPFRCVNYDGPAAALAARMAAACGWPVWADIGYPTPGSFGS